MKRILVTGGAGFIGSHTVDLLLEKGYQVTVYDDFSAGRLTHLNVFHPNLKVVQGDILDYAFLLKEMGNCDAVLHLAALPSVPKSIENPFQSLKVNTLGFVHVLQAVRELKKKIRVVYASSAAVYGDSAVPCNDDIRLSENFLSPYALEKANDERYADLFSRLFDIQCLGLRYFNVYGPRQDPSSPYSGVISKFMSGYLERQPIMIFGDGKQSRDFIYVKDVARANLLAIESEYCGAMNIATGVPETLLNLIHYIEKAGGQAAETLFVEKRMGDIQESYGAVKKAKKHLQFQSEVNLEQGMKQLLNS